MQVASFVDHLEFEFEGNIMKNAICLGDVDNDGMNELIVGNDNGDLAIFKGEGSRPIKFCHDLGIVSAIAVGDLLNTGHNVLVAVTGCGHCYIYDFENENMSETTDKKLNPTHSQRIPANIKIMLIGDVNGDGFSELVVGLTDRIVRTYRWVNGGNIVGEKPNGKLIGLNKWELAEQIGSLTFNTCADGTPSLLVSQPGGTYFTLKVDPSLDDKNVDNFDEIGPELLTKMSLDYEPLMSAKSRNPNVQTEICGNIHIASADDLKGSKKQGSPYAVATLDGSLMMVQDGKTTWNIQINHQLFAICSLDLTGDGSDEVVACAWDGKTYIICPNNDCVCFTFQEPVISFTGGMYGIRGVQVPCLVYVTFNNQIYVYYNITLPYLPKKTLHQRLISEPKYLTAITKLGFNVDDVTSLKELNHFLLYGFLD